VKAAGYVINAERQKFGSMTYSGNMKAISSLCGGIAARSAGINSAKQITKQEFYAMNGEGCHNLPGFFYEAVSLLNRYHREFGKVPDDLIAAVKYEIERSPLYIGISFYSWLL
jgi:hypothetical protein